MWLCVHSGAFPNAKYTPNQQSSHISFASSHKLQHTPTVLFFLCFCFFFLDELAYLIHLPRAYHTRYLSDAKMTVSIWNSSYDQIAQLEPIPLQHSNTHLFHYDSQLKCFVSHSKNSQNDCQNVFQNFRASLSWILVRFCQNGKHAHTHTQEREKENCTFVVLQ